MPELIVLERLNLLPKDCGYQMTSPIAQEKAQAWAAQYKAARVYYWPKTKTAYIVIEAAHA